MTKDEIKQSFSMDDIVMRYGFSPNRAGFIHCPFHKSDRTASLKIYKDSFYCFGCGQGGDIFRFVMLMDGLSYKDAFISLGGTYETAQTKNEARHIKRDVVIAERNRQKQQLQERSKRNEMYAIGNYLSFLIGLLKRCEPLSDSWCLLQNEIPKTYGKWLELWEEVNKDVNKD